MLSLLEKKFDAASRAVIVGAEAKTEVDYYGQTKLRPSLMMIWGKM